MRKITQDVGNAFINGNYRSVGNSMTNGTYLYLHGNEIMYKDDEGKMAFTLAGWGTPTTRERINGVLELLGSKMRVRQKDYDQCITINGEFSHFIHPNEWIDVK